MKYTRENLEKCLEKIDPWSFDTYKNKAKQELPYIMRELFAIGFSKALKSSFPMSSFFTIEEMDILLRAYDNLAGEGHGYFEFEE